jgi:KUP system potassium uptake protein
LAPLGVPALLLNYFGQGAVLLGNPLALENPFYRLAPEWAVYPLVLLAAAATIIASQAVISGTFSITRQAVQLGYLPRLGVHHTSEQEIGQVYVPRINSGLLVAVIILVFGFRSSDDHHRARLSLYAQPGLEPRPRRADICCLRPHRSDISRRQFIED